MNRIVWAMLLLLTSAPAGADADTGEQTVREQSQLTAPMAGVAEVRVENARGRIEVTPSADAQLHLTALKIVRGSATAEIQRFSRDTRVEAGREGGRYAVRVRYPQRVAVRVGVLELFRGGFSMPRVEVRLAIQVPPGTPVVLVSTSGDVVTRGLAGPEDLSSTSGDVRVDDATGRVVLHSTSGDLVARHVAALEVRTTSGDISIDGATALSAHTTSGDLGLRGVTGPIEVETTSGDVRLDAAPAGLTIRGVSGDIQVTGAAAGQVAVHTTSGSVDVALGPGVRGARLESVSGSIEARMVDRVGAVVDAQTRSGTIDTDVPVTNAEVGRHALNGTLRGGGAPLVMRSLSGDISIRTVAGGASAGASQ